MQQWTLRASSCQFIETWLLAHRENFLFIDIETQDINNGIVAETGNFLSRKA